MTRSFLAPPARSGPVTTYVKTKSTNPSKVEEKRKRPEGSHPPPTPLPLKGLGWGGGDTHQEGEGKQNKFETALRLARSLSKAEQKELLAQLAADQQDGATGSDREFQAWLEALRTGLGDVLGGETGHLPQLTHLKRSMASGGWKAISAFMRVAGFQKLSVVERQQAYNLLARLLIQHAQEVSRRSGAPQTPQLLGSCAVNMSSIFENAFPGYLSAGFAPIVVRRMGALAQER